MNIPAKELPTVLLYSVDNVTYSSASFRGAIASVGSARVTRHGFCWNTEGEPTLDNGQACNFGDCSEAKDYTYAASGLVANTTYYVRAYAENMEGVSYSNVIKFQTTGTPERPTVETGTASGITVGQAIVSGNITGLGNVETVTAYGHVWSEKANPTVSDSKTTLGSTQNTGAYNSTLTGLKPNTTYHVRAYATNNVGTAYGDDVTFTTLLGDIVLKTTGVTSVMSTSAVVSCTVVSTGGHVIIERGVCWGTSPLPTVGGDSKAASAQTATYEVKVEGLTSDTRYYARAYAKSQNGLTYYAGELSFTTKEKNIVIGKGDYGEDSNWEL